jgi:hypothetical protein
MQNISQSISGYWTANSQDNFRGPGWSKDKSRIICRSLGEPSTTLRLSLHSAAPRADHETQGSDRFWLAWVSSLSGRADSKAAATHGFLHTQAKPTVCKRVLSSWPADFMQPPGSSGTGWAHNDVCINTI